MRSFVLVLWCSGVVLTEGQSIFQQLGITSPKSPYSPSTSLVHQSRNKSARPSSEGVHYNCLQGTDVPRVCHCTTNYVGTPPECHPTPEYWDLCIKDNPCGHHSECDVTANGTRACSCMFGFEGRAPNCRPALNLLYCEEGDENNPCGPNSECSELRRQCYCLSGYVGSPPNCTTGGAV